MVAPATEGIDLLANRESLHFGVGSQLEAGQRDGPGQAPVEVSPG